MTEIHLNQGERIDQLFSSDVKIIQNKEVFSYSIDSVLLSRFPHFSKGQRLILDLCAGNGAVGLFASRNTKAKIIGIEIQERLADMARRSILLNQLEDQVEMICDDLKHIHRYVDKHSVDLILCNPPYFKVDKHSNLNDSPHYLLARHEMTTNLAEICQIASSCLKYHGHLVMVHRPDRFLEILEELKKEKLAPKKVQFIYPKQGKEANMLLIEAIKEGAYEGFKILPPLFIHKEDGAYSKEIEEIYYGN